MKPSLLLPSEREKFRKEDQKKANQYAAIILLIMGILLCIALELGFRAEEKADLSRREVEAYQDQ